MQFVICYNKPVNSKHSCSLCVPILLAVSILAILIQYIPADSPVNGILILVSVVLILVLLVVVITV